MIQLALAVKDTVRIGFLQTSKNWESLEEVIKKTECGLRGLSHSPLFYGSSWRLAHIRHLYKPPLYEHLYMGPLICSPNR